jgi:IclR helix-turn-helix domain
MRPAGPHGVPIVGIVVSTMERFSIDAYVVDVLMPDLVGHDRRPATFVVYLYLLRQVARGRRDTVNVSLQTISTKTGLSKSTVQTALRHLRSRKLIDPSLVATVTAPARRVLRPWART